MINGTFHNNFGWYVNSIKNMEWIKRLDNNYFKDLREVFRV